MPAPHLITTPRLRLRRPTAADASAILSRYSGDESVTRLLGWPRHRSPDDTAAFLRFADAEWEDTGAGPYLIESRESGALLGGTGLSLETAQRASTGYVLARSEWGRGYATEALAAMVRLSDELGVIRLYALCHPDHEASRRVLEKCGFTCEGTLRKYIELPNFKPGEPSDVLCYSKVR